MNTLCFILVLSLCAFEGRGQSDYYVSLKNNYDRLRKENKQDSALLIARYMNDWAQQKEGDSSLNYAVTFRYLGNIFISVQKIDSAIYYYNRSLDYLKRQNREINQDYVYECDY
jgi:hypothetical protein